MLAFYFINFSPLLDKMFSRGIKELLAQSAYFGVFLSLARYAVGLLLYRRLRVALLNPLLVSVLITIVVLALFARFL